MKLGAYCVFLILNWCGPIQADLLLTYDLLGIGGVPTSVSPNSTSVQIVGGNLTRGSGLIASTGGLNGINSFSSTGWNSLTNQDYVSFGFQVNPGYQATVGTVQFRTNAENSAPANIGLFSSQDAFGTAVASFGILSGNATYWTLDTSTLQQVSGAIEFRLYATNSNSIGGGIVSENGALMFGNFAVGRDAQFFQVNGTIAAVPEPTTIAMFLTIASIYLFMGCLRCLRTKVSGVIVCPDQNEPMKRTVFIMP